MNAIYTLKENICSFRTWVFFFILALILIPPPSIGKDIEKDFGSNGAIANLVLIYSDETLSLPLVGFSETIQGAVDLASDGNVLVVFPGTYSETITISKNIFLQGANVGVNPNTGARVIESIISDGNINILGSNTVTIDGFHIFQTNTVTPVSLGGSAEVIFQNNILERFGTTTGSTVRGIEISNGSGVKEIRNNKFTGDVSGGLFSGHKTWNSGIFLNGPLSLINIDNNVFENCRTAVNIDDMGSGITLSGNIFQNTGTFLSFGGTSPTTGSFALEANEFKTLISTFVNLSNVSPDFRLDISAGTYNGTAFSALPLATLFGIESTMFHRNRSGRNGLVYYVPGNQYVLNAVNNSIQSAIDYAASNDIINVQEGTYSQNLMVNKPLGFKGANFGINPNTGTRVGESILNGTFSLQSSGINIDGFTVTGAGSAFAAGGAGPWSNISLANNIAESNTGQQTIVYGFASGAVTTSIGAQNWEVSNNRIVDVQSANATALALFNIDGLIVNGNIIEHTNTSFTGRRGINLDGSINVTVSGNTIDMGDIAPSALTNAPFGIQISMSDRAVSNITISGNSFARTYSAVVGLSQRNLSGVLIENNDVSDVFRAFTFNSGGAVPVSNGTNMANITINGNLVDASDFAVWLRNLHSSAGTGPVSFSNISVSENSFIGGSFTVDADLNVTDGPVSGTCNWYGSSDFESVDAMVSGAINFVPFLTNGTDNEPSVIGFQPVPNACNGIAPVRVYSDGTETTLLSSHGTIQEGVNAAVTGNVVRVDAGTYIENVIVTKDLEIRGANYGIDPNTSVRGPESIVQGSSSTSRAFQVTCLNTTTNVSVDGFLFELGSPLHDGNDIGNGPSNCDVSFTNNLVQNANAIYYGQGTSWKNVLISNNLFQDINATPTASALQLLGGSLSATITDNVFNNMNYSAISSGSIPSITIAGNVIDGTGNTGIQLANEIGDAIVQNNSINNANNISQEAGRGAIRLYGSSFTGTVLVKNNTITGGYTGIAVRDGENISGKDITITENSITGLLGGKAIYNGAISGELNATCNWFGSVDFANVNGLVSGAVNFVPFLTNGTDNEPSILGFQPVANACGGVAPVRVYSDVTETTLLSSHGTIQAGVDAAVAGNVVKADAGTYVENVLVNKSIFIRGSNFGINPNTGTRVAESILNGTFSLQSSGINIDGFTVTGAGSAFAAGGAGPWSNISLTNNIADANTGQQTIVYGFASGNVTTSIGAENWTVSNNRITDIRLADATAIALFNITGLTISNNTILHSNASFNGRRGMNIDGSRDVVISGNTVDLGIINPFADNSDGTFTKARYSLQLSASDRSVSNVSVTENTFGGAYDGIITLGNGEFSGINLLSNEISNVVIAIRTQAGTNTPTGSHSNFTISNNTISSSNRSIFLQSGGAGTLDPYNAISITENSLLRSSAGAALEIEAIAVITDGNIAANCNWFGSADFAVVDDLVTGAITFEPFLTDGTDNAQGTIGFQPLPGKCNGTAIPPLSIVSFTLIDAGTDLDILTITDGLQISQSQVQGLSLNIRANTNPAVVGSVFMTLSGPLNRSTTENVAPYALFGDSNGNFNGRTLPLGNYTLTSQAYSGTNRNGTAGILSSVQFSIVAAPVPVTGITTTPPTSSLVVGNTLQITATVLPANATNKTVTWSTSDPGVASVSNSGLVSALSPGETTITATTQDGGFTDITLVTVTANNPPLSIVGFTLINAGTDSDILTITDGLQISQSQTQGLSLNIRANTFPSVVGSVFMTLSGPVNRSVTENVAPYALFGDNNGNYNGRTLPVGNYTLTARAYSSSNRGGTAGALKTINFSIISGSFRINGNQDESGIYSESKENDSVMEKGEQQRDGLGVNKIYPNPVEDKINLELSKMGIERVEISIFDMKGVQLLNQEYDSENGSLVLDIANLRLKPGTHVLLVNTNGYQQVFKFLKK
jgi:poly-gamma-glutamate capsule biosynthesis protein CapA/YwtB (metallophosphatase superfamily)